jgi:hypothetical protein
MTQLLVGVWTCAAIVWAIGLTLYIRNRRQRKRIDELLAVMRRPK